jgi:hypothetical protein
MKSAILVRYQRARDCGCRECTEFVDLADIGPRVRDVFMATVDELRAAVASKIAGRKVYADERSMLVIDAAEAWLALRGGLS